MVWAELSRRRTRIQQPINISITEDSLFTDIAPWCKEISRQENIDNIVMHHAPLSALFQMYRRRKKKK